MKQKLLDDKEPLTKGSKPYGANKEMEGWAKARKLKYCPSIYCPFHWLAGEQCSNPAHEVTHHWMDHVSCWQGEDGRRMVLAQPYVLGVDALWDLVRTCKLWGFGIRVDGSGWYGHGTVTIELHSR